jgi:hypothetical protein
MAIVLVSIIYVSARASTLDVGTDRRYERIEDVNAEARPGDIIRVHARSDNAHTSELLFRGSRRTYRS